MKTAIRLYKEFAIPYLVLTTFICLSFISFGQAPTHTAKLDQTIDENINGFWEYLPRNYQSETSKKYPLIIFIHGAGEQGSDPNNATLNRVLDHGLPRLIADGNFPESFTVNGTLHRFIVLSPQIKDGFDDPTLSSSINPLTIDTLIRYAIKTYRIDESRIYLAGLSMGGGATWKYAGNSAANSQKIAAIAVTCAAADLTNAEAAIIANSNLPVLATHNSVDAQITSDRTVDNVTKITNQASGGNVAPRMIIWNSPGLNGGHDSWNRTFRQIEAGSSTGGNVTDTLGLNTYEWLLQFSRTAVVPVRWLDFTAVKSGFDVVLSWKVSDEVSVARYEVEKSFDAVNWVVLNVVNPTMSSNNVKDYLYTDRSGSARASYYRIKQIDLDGKFSYSKVVAVTAGSVVSGISVFPTVFKNKLDLHSSDGLRPGTIITIVDLKGRHHFRHILQADTNSFTVSDISHLAAGAYVLQVTAKDGRLLAVHKIFK